MTTGISLEAPHLPRIITEPYESKVVPLQAWTGS